MLYICQNVLLFKGWVIFHCKYSICHQNTIYPLICPWTQIAATCWLLWVMLLSTWIYKWVYKNECIVWISAFSIFEYISLFLIFISLITKEVEYWSYVYWSLLTIISHVCLLFFKVYVCTFHHFIFLMSNLYVFSLLNFKSYLCIRDTSSLFLLCVAIFFLFVELCSQSLCCGILLNRSP